MKTILDFGTNSNNNLTTIKNMKKLLYIVIAILIGVYLFGKLGANKNGSSSTSNQSGTSTEGNSQALELIKKEPKVLEAIITEANVLYVSVVDDGTRRDGYASYLCEILREKKALADRVKVVKHNSTNDPNKDNAYGVLLGESWCK